MRFHRTLLFAIAFLPLGSTLAQDTANLGNTTKDGRLAPRLANLGHLRVPITVRSKDAKAYFSQGMTLVYGFNHVEALRSFKEVARLEPDCAMAYWGQALALAPNINDPAIGPDREKQGFDAMREAKARKGCTSPREQALIDALAARFAETPPGDDRTALNQAYAKSMAAAYAKFPRDPDVASLYADAIMNTQPWNYWTRDSKPNAGVTEARKALEQAIAAHPNHPGARHLYIHLMEASDEVDLATPSADRLATLVPAAGHLVHMPAHIYIRVGRYSDAAEANVKAIGADEDYITQCRAQGIYPAAYYPHNIHFLAAALMMDGRSAAAMDAARKVATRHDHGALDQPGMGFVHVLKTMPLMVMVRFGRWDELLAEPKPNFPFGDAVYYFARGFAFAAKGQLDDARKQLESLKTAASARALVEMKAFDSNSLATVAQIGVSMLEGEIALREGKPAESIAAFKKAVDTEDGLFYTEPADWLLPPREFLADAYLRAGDLVQAEATYRADLKRHRANGWSLTGLAVTLNKAGKAADAAAIQKEFDRAWVRADVKLTASRF